MEFFVPGFDDRAAAEVRWAQFAAGFVQECRAVYSLTYQHDGSDIEVTVGHVRAEWQPKKGPRGGRRAGLTGPQPTGTKVIAIVDAGTVIEVWSEGPPYGGWHNPSLIAPRALHRIQYFRSPEPRASATGAV